MSHRVISLELVVARPVLASLKHVTMLEAEGREQHGSMLRLHR